MTITSQPGRAAVLASPYTPIGHTSMGPVFHAAGGRGGGGIDFIVGDDEGEDPEFDDEEDEEDEDDDPRSRRRQRDDDRDDDRRDDQGADWTPPDRAAWEAMETALARANREAMNRRKTGKVLSKLGVEDVSGLEDFFRSRGIDLDSGERAGDAPENLDDAGPDDTRASKGTITRAQHERDKLRAEQRGASRVEAKYRDATTLLAAENALRGAGWSGENLNLALRLIDPDRVEVTMDSGELTVDGLEEQIAEIRDEFPNWFRPTSRDRNPNRRREASSARAVDGGNRDKPPARRLGWKEQMDRQIMRGGR
jgi:hypothetical protein